MQQIFHTDRLGLRQFVVDDATELLKIFADGGMPHLAMFGPLDSNYALGFLERMLESYRANGFGLWAVVEKASGNLIGYCGLHNVIINDEKRPRVELAYRIYKPLWGKGFAAEAAAAVVKHAFDRLRMPELIACIAPTNIASKQVAEKVGMTMWQQGLFRGLPHNIYKIVASRS